MAEGFVQNTALLSLGTIAGQLIPIGALPWLSRLYQPEDFGVYTLFQSAINMVSQLGCLKYDMAITMAGEEEQGNRLFALSMVLSALTGIIFIPIALVWNSVEKDAFWIFFLPLGAALTGWYLALTGYCLRMEQYGAIAQASILKTTAMVLVQLWLCQVPRQGMGLVWGYLAANGVGICRLLPAIVSPCKPIHIPSLRELWQTAVTYRHFPMFTLPGSLASSMVYNLPSYFLAGLYSQTQLGYYAMANRLVFTPISMLSTSLSQVFTRMAAKQHSRRQEPTVFRQVSRGLFWGGLVIFSEIFVFASPLVQIFLGSQWTPMLPLLFVMLPLGFMRFWVAPLSTMPIVLGKNAKSMAWQLLLFALSLLAPLAARWFSLPIEGYLLVLSLGLSGGYLFYYLATVRLIACLRKGEV